MFWLWLVMQNCQAALYEKNPFTVAGWFRLACLKQKINKMITELILNTLVLKTLVLLIGNLMLTINN